MGCLLMFCPLECRVAQAECLGHGWGRLHKTWGTVHVGCRWSQRKAFNQVGLLHLDAARYADLRQLAGCACRGQARQCI